MTIDRTMMIVIGLLNIPPTFIPSRFSKWFLEATTVRYGADRTNEQEQDKDRTHHATTTRHASIIDQPTRSCPCNGSTSLCVGI